MGVYDEILRWQLEESPFSEGFELRRGEGGPVEIVRGIFDEPVIRDPAVQAARVKPRIMVYRWPLAAAAAGTRVTVRGREYAVASVERDANLGDVVWLR
jgi:hypothetical protein